MRLTEQNGNGESKGVAGEDWRVRVWYGEVRLGPLWQGRRGAVRSGRVRNGVAGTARSGWARSDEIRCG